MLSDITDRVRAFDKLTGRLVWSDDTSMPGKEGIHTIVSPVVLTVGVVIENVRAYLAGKPQNVVV